MVINGKQITFMYGPEVAAHQIRKAWPRWSGPQDAWSYHGSSTTSIGVSHADWCRLQSHFAPMEKLIKEILN